MRRCLDLSKDVHFLLARVSAFSSSLYLKVLVRDLATETRARSLETGDEDRQALRSFESIRRREARPSTLVIVRALKACSNLKDIRSGRQIHGYLTETGDRDVTVANTLVHMYAKCGNMLEARNVFDKLPRRTVVSWNALIFGYARNRDPQQALELYMRLQDESFDLNVVTLIAGLKACASSAAQLETEDKVVKLGFLEKGIAIHRQAIKAGEEINFRVATSLVDMYAKCGSMSAARAAFDKMVRRCLVSWNSLIYGYAANGEGELAMKLYVRMQDEGFRPDAITYVAALKACSSSAAKEDGLRVAGTVVKLECLEKGMSLHSQVLTTGEESNTKVANSLVHMYIKCGSLLDARSIFDRMSYRTVVTWNSVIFGYSDSGNGDLALQMLGSMTDEGLVPDAVTYIAALKSCGEIASRDESKRRWCLERGRGIHLQATDSGVESGLKLSNTLLDMYAKCGSMTEAEMVFNGMRAHDVVSWNSLIMGYAAAHGESAMRLFKLMQVEGVLPDYLTFIAAFKACGSLGSLQTGRELHGELHHLGFDSELNTLNSLIDFYGKCGCMPEAQTVFESMLVKRDLVTWNALIGGYAQQADTDRVFHLFDQMQRQERVEPNDITFLCLLKVCSHAGLVDKGRDCFEMLLNAGRVKWGIKVNIEHYTCVVDMLGRANRLPEAVRLVEEMPFEADQTIWTSILSSSRKWKNVEVARVAYESILKLEREDKVSAAYLLMAYALMGARAEEGDDDLSPKPRESGGNIRDLKRS